MKSILIATMALILSACGTPMQQSSVPPDMQAVEQYQQRVASGRTMDKSQPDWELNQSDKRPRKVIQVVHPRPYYYHYPVGIHFGIR